MKTLNLYFERIIISLMYLQFVFLSVVVLKQKYFLF